MHVSLSYRERIILIQSLIIVAVSIINYLMDNVAQGSHSELGLPVGEL